MVTKWAGGLLRGSWINRPFHQSGRSWLEENRVVPCLPRTCMCLSNDTGMRRSRSCTQIVSLFQPGPNEHLEKVKRCWWCLQSHLLIFTFMPSLSSKGTLISLEKPSFSQPEDRSCDPGLANRNLVLSWLLWARDPSQAIQGQRDLILELVFELSEKRSLLSLDARRMPRLEFLVVSRMRECA